MDNLNLIKVSCFVVSIVGSHCCLSMFSLCFCPIFYVSTIWILKYLLWRAIIQRKQTLVQCKSTLSIWLYSKSLLVGWFLYGQILAESTDWNIAIIIQFTNCFVFFCHREVGFLRYFQLKQLPNFLLALPLLFLGMCSIIAYAKQNYHSLVSLGFQVSYVEKEAAAVFYFVQRRKLFNKTAVS